MAKFNPYSLSKDQRKKLLNEFFMVMALLKDYNEMRKFLTELLSESEQIMLVRRLQIAKMLLEGAKYEEIRIELGVGYENINKVKKWLDAGGSGYLKAIERLEKKQLRREVRQVSDEVKYNPFSFYNIRKKYGLGDWPGELTKEIEVQIKSYMNKQKHKNRLKK